MGRAVLDTYGHEIGARPAVSLHDILNRDNPRQHERMTRKIDPFHHRVVMLGKGHAPTAGTAEGMARRQMPDIRSRLSENPGPRASPASRKGPAAPVIPPRPWPAANGPM